MDVGDSCSYTSKLTITLFFHLKPWEWFPVIVPSLSKHIKT